MIPKIKAEVGAASAAFGAVFRNPPLRNLALSWGAISIATWAFVIALAVYAFDYGGATAVGVVALIRLLPGAVASPLAGLVSDKHSRRRVLVWSTALVTVTLAVAAAVGLADGPAALVFALAGLFTIASTPFLPAEAALMPQLAQTPRELAAANLIKNLMDNGGFLLGSIATGIALGLGSTGTAFALAAVAALGSLVAAVALPSDQRPDYARGIEAGKLIGETLGGFSLVLRDASLRLPGAMIALLAVVEGAADVLIVVTALDLLGLSDSSVGYLNAAWAIGGLIGGLSLAVLLNRGHLIRAGLAGSVLIAIGLGLPSALVVAVAAYVGFFLFGSGHSFVDVVANTLLQRLGDDESLGRIRGSLESVRLAATAAGSILVPVTIAMVGIRWTLFGTACLLLAYLIFRASKLTNLEMGAPLDEGHYELLRSSPIFAPLPVATLERICHEVEEEHVAADEDVIVQGELGNCFYLIESGEVEVFEDSEFRRRQGPGEGFGEIALLHATRRTATVRTKTPTKLLVLAGDVFVEAVTGHSRSNETAHNVAVERLGHVQSERE